VVAVIQTPPVSILSLLLFPPTGAGFEFHPGAVSPAPKRFHEQQAHEAENRAIHNQPEHHVVDDKEHWISRRFNTGVHGNLDKVLVDLLMAIFASGLQVYWIDG
jgi:hypothetical protein